MLAIIRDRELELRSCTRPQRFGLSINDYIMAGDRPSCELLLVQLFSWSESHVRYRRTHELHSNPRENAAVFGVLRLVKAFFMAGDFGLPRSFQKKAVTSHHTAK